MTSEFRVRPRVRSPAIIGVALAGAVLGSAWDQLHVRTHTIIYSIGTGRMPLWVPLEFAIVYVAGVIGIARLGAPAPDARRFARLGRETAWVTVVYAITAFGHRHELIVFALCALALVVRRRTFATILRGNAIPAAALVIAGPVVETSLIHAGLFHYTHASLGNVALWLPLLYANAVPFGVRLTEAAVEGPA